MMVNKSLIPTPLFEFYNSNNSNDPLWSTTFFAIQ